MKRKPNDRPLMRQRVNVSPTLINKWKENYLFDIRHVIHQLPLEKEHLGQTIEHQDRTFEILGMGESRSIMLKETRPEGIFYWECTRQFVQMKLGLFNKEFVNLPNGKTTLKDMPYSDTELLLAPLKATRKAKSTEDETEETPSNEFEQIEEYQDEIADESQNDLF
jgi:hypothetical protein